MNASGNIEKDLSTEINLKREIYSNFITLVKKVENSSPLLTNLGIVLSFSSKMASLEVMKKYTIKASNALFKTYLDEKKSHKSIVPKDLNLYYQECVAFFEGYLNAFYSLLQVIGKITPYFYEQEDLKKIEFGEQIEYFSIKKPDLDITYGEYLKNNLSWYSKLVCNRHGITHNVAVFLGFGKTEIEFIHMPKRRIDYFQNGKPSKKLIDYLKTNWNSLFDYMNFYFRHFSNLSIFVDKEKELSEIQKILSKNTKNSI